MSPLEPGSIFARDFKVVRALAKGGMGSVYEVEQLSTGKARALKLLHAQLAGDPKIRARFEQEARVGALIESDHIVDVVAAGVEDPGTPWLVMEFLKGVDLAKHLEHRGAVSPSEVLEIFKQMGHALGAAHRVNLVHRDLKPENIFLAESRREGAPFTVKVLDFGIAKAIEAFPGRATQAMGTPFWMSPEQCEDSKLISPATDVWAMGLIAYSLLTAACYWRSAQTPDQSVAGVLLEMTVRPLDAPSIRAGEYGRAQLLPPGFDAWFSRCVARSPDQRFRDATECVAALIPVLSAPTAFTAVTLNAAQLGAVTPASLPVAPPPPQPVQSSPPMTQGPGQPAPFAAAAPWPSQAVPYPSVALPPQASTSQSRGVAVAIVLVGALLALGTVALVALRFKSRFGSRGEEVIAPSVPSSPLQVPTNQGAAPSMIPVIPPAPPIPMIPMMPSTPSTPALTPTPMPRMERLITVRLDAVEALFGDVSSESAAQVRGVLMARTLPVRQCVENAGRTMEGVRAFSVRFKISPTGSIEDISGHDRASPSLVTCLGHRLRVTFPATAGGRYRAIYLIR